MPAPINSVRTRVIDTGSGYVAQLSTDGLMWFDLPDPRLFVMRFSPPPGWPEPAVVEFAFYADKVAHAASRLPSSGRVVLWPDGK